MPRHDLAEERVLAWFEALERRHSRDLTFAEIRRGLQALSALYVERRGADLRAGRALDGRGKRAAFALFYGGLHFLLVREILRELAPSDRPSQVIDLGCGTGVAAAAWALHAERPWPPLFGVDRNGWVLDEARWTWALLGLHGRTKRGEVDGSLSIQREAAIVAAFSLNEMSETARESLLTRLVRTKGHHRLLVVEPVARRALPWWPDWRDAVVERGGREDVWRFDLDLPPALKRLDAAAGLDHRVLSARTLWFAAGSPETHHGAEIL